MPNTWSFRVGCIVVSTDYLNRYKVDYFIKGSLSSSLVFTLIQKFVFLPNSKRFKFITILLF